MGGGRIIRAVDLVLRKADRVENLVRRLLDGHRNTHAVQEIHHCAIKIGDRPGCERKRSFLASAGADSEPVAHKVELNLEDFVAVRYRRGAKSPSGHIEWNLPAMVDPGS